jgi:thiamine biosynthesis lipoprotein
MIKGKLLFVIIVVFLFSSCKKELTYYETSGEVFKTSFHIKYKYSRVLVTEIEDCFERFNLSLNPFNRESIIYKVNNNIPVEIDDWFITVFNKAMEISEISGGTYDLTSAPLINLWGFGFSRMDSVNQEIIDSLKQFVGYRKMHLEGRKVIKNDSRLQLNVSSIAKGYACDVIAKLLESYEITDYMVEIGGEIHANGTNSKGVCWRIEIPKPLDDRAGRVNERMDVVELCNRSIATSGNYRNYYILNGKKIAHIINPQTGYPVESNILSASVFASDCMTADAFATAFMTMNLDKAIEVAKQISELDYIFIYTDKTGNLQEVKSDLHEVY